MRPLLVCLIAVLPSLAADDWPMAFHDAQHSGRTAEIVTPPLTVAWTWKDTLAYDNDPKWKKQPYPWLPIFYQGRLYIQGGLNANRLFVLDPAKGALLWEADNPGYTANGNYLFQFSNYPVAVKGRILYASTDFTATMDAATGADFRTVYNTNGGWPFGGAALWNGRAILQYVETDDGSEDLRIVSDPVKLTIAGGRAYADQKAAFTDYAFRVPAVDNNTVFANRLGQLVGWSPGAGADLWTWGSRNFGASPAVWNHILYFYASSQSALVAIPTPALAASSYRLAGLPVLWSAQIAGAYSPIVSDGVVYAGSSDGNFYALDARTGAVKWSLATKAAFSSVQIPAISGGLIYIPGTDGILYVLNKDTGAEVWRYTGTAAFGPVVIGGGRVFVSDANFALYGFQAASAATGPSVGALTLSRVSPGTPIGIAGAGFTGATSVQVDDAAHTALTGFTVAGDNNVTGAVVPASLAPGRYHISVTTPAGRSVDGPELEVTAVGSFLPSVLGIAQGKLDHGADQPFQRHLVRLSDGSLVASYSGRVPADGAPDIWFVCQISRDGGKTWGAAVPLYTGGSSSAALFAASFGIAVSPADQVQAVFQQWPSYHQAFAAYSYDGSDFLQPAAAPVLFANTPNYAGPMVAEPGGKLWVAYSIPKAQGSAVGDLFASWSSDGGATWTQTAKISQTSGATPAMTLFNGLPLVVYTDGTTLAWSARSGADWSAPQPLPGNLAGAGVNLSLAATADGKVHLATATTAGVVYLGFDGTAWSAPAVLENGATSPSITTNGADLWCFYATASKNIAYRHWSAASSAWDAAVAVTSDAAVNSRPATLALSPDAGIPVIWNVGSAPPFEVHSAVIPALGGAAALEARLWASPLLVIGTQATLIASPAGGSPPYTFAWSAPAGASLNSTASGAPSAIFASAGTFHFGLTVRDAAGSSYAASADVSVAQVPSAITVAAPSGPMAAGGQYRFTAAVVDQFGNPVAPAPALTWTLTPATCGVIDTDGKLLALFAGDCKVTANVPGGIAGSLTVTFGAAGSVPIMISNVTQSAVTRNSATIQWTTSIAADSQVEYGSTADYGSVTPLNPTLTLDHSVPLAGLTPGKIYHYRVRSKTSTGSAVSADFRFTTLGTARPVGR